MAKNCIGLDIGSSAVKVVQVKQTKRGIQLVNFGIEPVPPQSIVDGSVMRCRPVILTTITTVAGLLPTAYGIGGDLPFIRPMVLALAWGLVFGTLISLVFIPLIYTLYRGVKA